MSDLVLECKCIFLSASQIGDLMANEAIKDVRRQGQAFGGRKILLSWERAPPNPAPSPRQAFGGTQDQR
jgi:hypothetical protein